MKKKIRLIQKKTEKKLLVCKKITYSFSIVNAKTFMLHDQSMTKKRDGKISNPSGNRKCGNVEYDLQNATNERKLIKSDKERGTVRDKDRVKSCETFDI